MGKMWFGFARCRRILIILSACFVLSARCLPAEITRYGFTNFLANTGVWGDMDGLWPNAAFVVPSAIAIEKDGTLFLAEYSSTIREVSPSGLITTVAGRFDQPGSEDGQGTNATFHWPQGLAVDRGGNLFVADTYNHAIRKITPNGTVSTLAGLAESPGFADGVGVGARFTQPQALTVDDAGNIYVADTGNATIRKITPQGAVTTLAGLPGQGGSVDGVGAAARFGLRQPDFVVKRIAGFGVMGISGIAVDGAGMVYVADAVNFTIRKVTPAGEVTTLAGTSGQWGHADGFGIAAQFGTLGALSADPGGNVYVADWFGQIIRKVTTDGFVATIGGAPSLFSHRTDGVGGDAQFSSIVGIALDRLGNLSIADEPVNQIIRGTKLSATIAEPRIQSVEINQTGLILYIQCEGATWDDFIIEASSTPGNEDSWNVVQAYPIANTGVPGQIIGRIYRDTYLRGESRFFRVRAGK